MYCRHCQRRRNIGDRDVLITGGDPLTLSDEMLEWVLSDIRSIDHVDYI